MSVGVQLKSLLTLLRWDTCITGVKHKVDPDTLSILFINQIEDIELLSWEMKAFEKLLEKKKTYEKLYAICECSYFAS